MTLIVAACGALRDVRAGPGPRRAREAQAGPVAGRDLDRSELHRQRRPGQVHRPGRDQGPGRPQGPRLHPAYLADLQRGPAELARSGRHGAAPDEIVLACMY
ncbi:MAG: hypothetical protein MZV64_22795 [Ignavibacteriales bacterium]|nr:hypothetical protein [Ignavibacteriales bacterium]